MSDDTEYEIVLGKCSDISDIKRQLAKRFGQLAFSLPSGARSIRRRAKKAAQKLARKAKP